MIADGEGRARSGLTDRRAVRPRRGADRVASRADELFGTPPACSTPPTSRACTTCASRRGACARCWRSSLRACSASAIARVLRDVKSLAAALGERRDPDVHARRAASSLPSAARRPTAPGVERLADAPARASRRRATRCSRRRSPRDMERIGPARAAAGAGRRRARLPRMKARTVHGLDPERPLADAPRGSSRCASTSSTFMPQALGPARGDRDARHAHRREAPALRARARRTSASAPYARDALRPAKELQDLLGEIHDCDVAAACSRALEDAQRRATRSTRWRGPAPAPRTSTRRSRRGRRTAPYARAGDAEHVHLACSPHGCCSTASWTLWRGPYHGLPRAADRGTHERRRPPEVSDAASA